MIWRKSRFVIIGAPADSLISLPADSLSQEPMANPARNCPRGFVGLCCDLNAFRATGPRMVSVTRLIPVALIHGCISSCPFESTHPGRTTTGLKRESPFPSSVRAFSVSPLTLPNKGVNNPGSHVAPSPDTKTNLKSSWFDLDLLNAWAASSVRIFVV